MTQGDIATTLAITFVESWIFVQVIRADVDNSAGEESRMLTPTSCVSVLAP
jgi:hypothetical protein